MNEIDKESIEKKITSSVFSDNDEENRTIKNSLLAIMRELCDYTTDVQVNCFLQLLWHDYKYPEF